MNGTSMTGTLARYCMVGCLFLVTLVPTIVFSAYFFPFITGKNFFFRILVEIAAVAWVVTWFTTPQYRPRATAMTIALTVFTLIIAAADVFGISPFKSFWSNFERMEGFVTLAHLALFALMTTTVFTEKLWIRWFATSVGVAAYVTIYGFTQLVGETTINQSADRLDANIGNSAYLAVYMIFHIFTALALGYRFRHWQRWIVWSLVPFMTIILYYTGTRGALLGFLAGAGVTALILAVTARRRHPTIQKIALGGVIAVVLVIAGFMVAQNTSFVQESRVLSRFRGITLENISETPRFIIWGMALEGVQERPLLGWGQENFNYVFNKYYDPRLFLQEQWFDRTHNVILDWFIAGGLLGLLSYFSLFVVLLWTLWRHTGHSLVEKAVITGMIVAYTVHNLFVFDSIVSYIPFFAWFAYINTAGRSYRDQHTSAPSTPSRVSQGVVLVACSVLVLFVLYSVPVSANGSATSKGLIRLMSLQQQPLGAQTQQQRVDQIHTELTDLIDRDSFARAEVAEQAYQIVSNITRLPVSDESKQAFFKTAAQALEVQVRRTPEDARYQFFMGTYLSNFNVPDLSFTYLEAALALSPEKEAFLLELGTRYLQVDQVEKGLAALAKAYTLGPQFPAIQKNYLVAALFFNKTVVANELLAVMAPEDLVSDTRIWAAMKYAKRTAEARTILTRISTEHPELKEVVEQLLKTL